MGVPKFFRWLSERYPTISQLIAENRIPEFDNLYLDMNGIIHNCTHNDSDAATKARVSEEDMFIKIFNYIEHLFGKIKPQKLFFLAIDGVAPRAKMNQQRSRRFRTALDAEKAREKAVADGLALPKEDPFDSNCITPGTDFMARLTRQLKYFIAKKISEDVEWQGCDIVLSGHEVPGEGEHKIMEYIRQAKSQPNYNPNVRHCCYGLDADLIMLGLLSHDPHFCLLREEVTFGRKGQAKSQELEHQNFYLMHLCIVREYLELEFQELKEPGKLAGVTFDMERIIDDFILMAFFVGNDFLPNLPHLHINEGALALMFETYRKVLPQAGGYINNGGVIDLRRLGLLLNELGQVEFRHFESENSDASWMREKSVHQVDVMEKVKRRGVQSMTSGQKVLYQKIKQYVNSRATSDGDLPPLSMPASLNAADRAFVEQLAGGLHLECKSILNDDGDRHLSLGLPPRISDDDDDEEDEESQNALLRVFKQYDRAKVEDVSASDAQMKAQEKYDKHFQGWKNKYYSSKFEWDAENDNEIKKLTENYVQGLQWVLFYYYRGIASWPWYYQYHYSPMISDVKKGLGADMNFKLGQPFRPFQQLMGVLPDRSKSIVPKVYWDLMTNPSSPIIDFYPRDFELDMNGKKMEWEAVVKIPFIDESRLLQAMASKDPLLSEAEKKRNEFGVSLKFTFSSQVDYTYPSTIPGVFPDLEHCHVVENIYELPTMDGLDVYVGLMDGVKLGEAALAGFPSLRTLPSNGMLGFHGVSVFQQESRNESMVITIADSDVTSPVSHAKQKLGKAVHVGYPFLQEGKVCSVSDELFTYSLQNPENAAEGTNVISKEHSPREIEDWKKKATRIEKVYSTRLGIVIGPVESLVQIEPLVGLRKTDLGATVKDYAYIQGIETDYASQTVVDRVISEDQRFLEKSALPIEQDFPLGTRAFFLGDMAHGRPLEVTGHVGGDKLEIWVSVLATREPEFGRNIVQQAERMLAYTPSYAVARQLHLHPLVLSKLTSAFNVNSSGLRLNVGLNLKFESKGLKVLGFSRKSANGWEYSPKAVDLITQYMIKFPEFIAKISANPSGDNWEDTAFYPDPQEAKLKMKEIGQWLKSVETKSFEKVPLDAEQLDGDTVMTIQAAADKNASQPVAMQGQKIGGVPRMALLKPAEAQLRTQLQNFSLGDRVVYVLESGRVPIAMRGTVVGKTRTPRSILLDIVFDSTFMSGTTLNGRCSPFRGSTVPSDAVLNVTERQVLAQSQAARDRAPKPAVAPLRNGYSSTAKSYGSSDGPRLVESQAPPALRGGWNRTLASRGGPPNNTGRGGFRGGRGGQNDFSSRGRGGGGNRGGYNIVDNSDPTEGVNMNNTHFRPQNYSNVPPPAALNNDGRGRGRGGRGRANGGGGRGGGRGRGQSSAA
jgi:5'-3' exoribonuclease 1